MDPQQMEKNKQRCAAIILNWNGLHLLRKYLPEVVRTTDPSLTRIIVADNGSTDESVQWLRQQYPEQVEVIGFDTNHGFAQGYNLAVSQCDYQYVVLLNSDLYTSEGWDRQLIEWMDAHPGCGAAQPKILSAEKPSMFEYAGAAGGFIDRNGYPFCRGRIFTHCEQDKGQYDEPMEIFWASGAAMMVRRSVYIDCGGLDKDFFAHMEEIDLCWRIRLAGWSIAAVPSAVVYHLGGGSLPAENPKKTYLNFRNNLLMLHKNLPDSCRRPFLFRRRLLDTLAWLKYVITLDFKNASAVLRAHRDFKRMRSQYTSHPEKNILPELPQGRLNILAEYYLKRHRTFDHLNP